MVSLPRLWGLIEDYLETNKKYLLFGFGFKALSSLDTKSVLE